ncbi:MAG: YMGG-like glycine zipper-containing protein [Rariglobus sp.]
MKTTISLLALVVAAAVPAQAQLFTPSTVGGAALGAVAGGVIGNNTGSRNNGTEGAVIGAVAGGLLGSAFAQSRREAPSPYYNTGAAPGYYYTSGPNYAPATYQPTPSWARPSRTATTTLLGGVAGAIIGHNNGRRAWQGAAIGAGSGYLLGRLTEPSVYRQPMRGGYTPYAYYRQAQPVVVTTPVAQPQQITIINNYYGNSSTPMSNANSMFGR